MKRILTVVGGITVAMLLAAVLGYLWIAPEGRRLDASSIARAASLLEGPISTWDLEAFKREASEEFLTAVPDDKLARLLGMFSERLGMIRSHGPPRGEARIGFTTNAGKIVTAEYVVPATFEKADGEVRLRLILKGDDWRLLAFNVNSDALMP